MFRGEVKTHITTLHRPCEYEDSNVIIDGESYEIHTNYAIKVLPYGSKIMRGHRLSRCSCVCQCCSADDVLDATYTHDALYALSMRRDAMVQEDDVLWCYINDVRKDYIPQGNYAARLLTGCMVIDVDRSEFWGYVANCADRLCLCRCDCCIATPDDMSDLDRRVYEHWLYYAKQLRNYIDEARDARCRKILSTIDAWSLQEKSYCDACHRYSIVRVYNNKGYADIDTFYVCLSCLTMFDQIDYDGYEGRYLRFIKLGNYDLC